MRIIPFLAFIGFSLLGAFIFKLDIFTILVAAVVIYVFLWRTSESIRFLSRPFYIYGIVIIAALIAGNYIGLSTYWYATFVAGVTLVLTELWFMLKIGAQDFVEWEEDALEELREHIADVATEAKETAVAAGQQTAQEEKEALAAFEKRLTVALRKSQYVSRRLRKDIIKAERAGLQNFEKSIDVALAETKREFRQAKRILKKKEEKAALMAKLGGKEYIKQEIEAFEWFGEKVVDLLKEAGLVAGIAQDYARQAGAKKKPRKVHEHKEIPLFEDKVLSILRKAGIKKPTLEVPDKNFGDYAFPCFALSKEQKKAPHEIAQELVTKLKPNAWVETISAHGPYINFTLNKSKVAEYVLTEIHQHKDNFGKNKDGRNKKVMIEFSSPNTNKPMHLGHVRNNVLGAALSNVIAANGYRAIKANLINDRGVHICKTMIAYKKWARSRTPGTSGKKGDHFVGDLYVQFQKAAETNKELEKQAQELLQKWEKGDKPTLELWEKMRKWCIDGFEKTYKDMGIEFDQVYYESKIWKGGKKMVSEGLTKEIFVKDDGAVKVFLEEKYKIPDKVLMRADGTALYMTQDMYLAKKRFDENNLSKLIYVVGSEQNLHFKQLFKILELLGYHWAKYCHHFSYGMVTLPSGVLKSRTGQVVDADKLIEETAHMAKDEIKIRYKNLSDAEMTARSKVIGLGAIKFQLLKIDPVKDMKYDPKESISFEGETGPYVQYAHARISSIIEKHGKPVSSNVNMKVFTDKNEHALIMLLSKYPAVVRDAGQKYDLHTLSHYLIDISKALNVFYTTCPVLQAETNDVKNARLYLLKATQQVLKNGLGLLGIDAPDRM